MITVTDTPEPETPVTALGAVSDGAAGTFSDTPTPTATDPATATDTDTDTDANTAAQRQPPTVTATAPAAATPTARPTAAADCGPLLKKTFPALFAGGPKPIKLRIQLDIQERAPGVFSKQALSAFFRRYTGSTSYLIAVSRAKTRFDLDGAPAGEVSEEHRQIALDELARRRGNLESRAALEEQQRRNRATLLHDFERTTLTPANFCALKGIAVDELDGYLATARREAAERPQPPRLSGDGAHAGSHVDSRRPSPQRQPPARPERRPSAEAGRASADGGRAPPRRR